MTEASGVGAGEVARPLGKPETGNRVLGGRDSAGVWSAVAGAHRWPEQGLLPEPLAAPVLS